MIHAQDFKIFKVSACARAGAYNGVRAFSVQLPKLVIC